MLCARVVPWVNLAPRMLLFKARSRPSPLRVPRTDPASRAGARPRDAFGRFELALGLWALAWLAWLALTSESPPVDNAEQLSWVRSVEWGYYKHPPLPTALLWPLVQLFGLHEWVSYAAAALLTLSAIMLGRCLTVELIGRQCANLATLGTLCIGYYSHRLAYFNHDSVLLLCGVAAAWFCWRAFADRSMSAWVGLGIALGLGALAKYQVAVAAGSVLAYWALRQGWRDELHRRGLGRAAAIALLIFSPHAIWFVTHDFLPLQYAWSHSHGAQLSLAQCSVGVLRWIGDQLSQLAGALVLGGGLLLLARRRRRAGHAMWMPFRPGAQALPFLLCFGLLPLGAMPCIALVMGASLHRNWGSAYMPFTCAALMLCAGRRLWPQVTWRDALCGFAAVQLVLAALLLAPPDAKGPTLNQHRSHRFSSQWVADEIGPPARRLLGSDIRVIAGRQRLASVLALRLAERPLVLIDGRYELSPWMPQDMSRVCGILWVGGRDETPPNDAERNDIGEGLWWAVQLLSDEPASCR